MRKLASAYGLTESQLRGDAPLPESLVRQIERRGLLPSPNGAEGGDPPSSDLEGGTSSLLLVAAAVAGLVALSAVPRLAFSLAAVLLAGAVAGTVAGAAVGWAVAAVVAVALYRAQR